MSGQEALSLSSRVLVRPVEVLASLLELWELELPP